MERHDECIRKAKQSITVAEHVLKVTYPLVKESKLLLSTLEQIHNAHIALMQGVLTYEREMRTIPPFHTNFESMWNVISLRLEKKYSPTGKELQLLKTVEQTIKFHKDSAVAFERKGDFILASDEYVIQKITSEFVAEILRNTQHLVTKWTGLLTK